jgi:dienelactone hydrolase
VSSVLIASVVIGGLGLIGLALFATANLRGWLIRSEAFTARVQRLSRHLIITSPPGEGPFATVVFFYGCGGPRANIPVYADKLAAAGIQSIIVDDYGARGLSREIALATVCTGQRLRGRERAADVLAGLAAARALPDVDGARLMLAGFSHGGWSIMDALSLALPRERPFGLRDGPNLQAAWSGLQGVALFYPYCGFPARTARRGWRVHVPVFAVVPGADTRVPLRATHKALDRLKRDGVPVEGPELAGVNHAFDEPDHPSWSQLDYDPEVTEAVAYDLVVFARRVLEDA